MSGKRAALFAIYLLAILLPGSCSLANSPNVIFHLIPAIPTNLGFALPLVLLNIAGFASAIFFGRRLTIVTRSEDDTVNESALYISLAIAAIGGTILFLLNFKIG